MIKNIGREKNLIEFISKNDDSAVRKNCMVDINFVNYRVQIFHLHKRVEKNKKDCTQLYSNNAQARD